MDFWSAESLEKHLQNPDVNISALAKIECYLYKALDDRMGDISECQNYYSLYTEAERDVAQKKVNFICTWIKEHPLDFDWTDEMEEANQQVQYQIYANKMLSYLKKNASAKEQFDTAVRFAIQYDVVDENNNVVTSYVPYKIGKLQIQGFSEPITSKKIKQSYHITQKAARSRQRAAFLRGKLGRRQKFSKK